MDDSVGMKLTGGTIEEIAVIHGQKLTMNRLR